MSHSVSPSVTASATSSTMTRPDTVSVFICFPLYACSIRRAAASRYPPLEVLGVRAGRQRLLHLLIRRPAQWTRTAPAAWVPAPVSEFHHCGELVRKVRYVPHGGSCPHCRPVARGA